MKKLLASVVIGVLCAVLANWLYTYSAGGDNRTTNEVCGIVPPCYTVTLETTKRGMPFASAEADGEVWEEADSGNVAKGMSFGPTDYEILPLGWLLNAVVYAVLVYLALFLVQKRRYAHNRH